MDDLHAVRDLSLATALVTSGHKLVDIDDDTQSDRKRFVFRASAKLDEDMTRYWESRMNIDAKTYATNLKELKQRMFYSMQD